MTPERYKRLRDTLIRRQPDLTVLAESVKKSHNIAALVRTCDAVGVHQLHVVSPGGEFQRHHMVAAGTQKWVPTRPHESTTEAISDLKRSGYRIVAAHLSEQATDYRQVDYTLPTALVLGSELTGVSSTSAQLADEHVIVPMRGMVDSLNVSVANAIILYEAARQREAAGLYETSRLPKDVFARTLFEWCYPDIARRCRVRGRPYPLLDENGFFSSNPLA